MLEIKRLRRLLSKARLSKDDYALETPLYAIELLLYIAQYQDDHEVLSSEIIKELDIKPDKLLRAIRKHLKDYIYIGSGWQDGVKRPVYVYTLTPKGQRYIQNLVEELKWK